MRRYAGYPMQASQPTDVTSGDILAGRLTDCEFGLAAPNLVTLRITVGDGNAEPLNMLSQTSLRHLP